MIATNIRRHNRNSSTLRLTILGPLLALSLACSAGGEDSDEEEFATRGTEPEPTTDQLQLLHEMNVDFLAKHQAQLSSEERELIEGYLGEQGLDVSRVTFSGRMLGLANDLDLAADDILAALSSTEKGRVLSSLVLREDGETWDPAPNFIARARTSADQLCGIGTPDCRFQFLRPNLQSHVFIVPDYFPWLKDVLAQAAHAIMTSADDCLNEGHPTLQVMSESEWFSLGLGAGFYTTTMVLYGPENQTCPSAPWEVACATFPSYNGHSKLRIGWRMAFRSDTGYIFEGSEWNLKVVTHEMMHTLGVGHAADTFGYPVPGTSGSPSVASIMHGLGDMAGGLSADDISVIDTLYSPRPGGTCNYQNSFQDTCAHACTRVSSYDITGHCCFCNGATKQFKRSSFNTQVYLCK